MKYLGIDYGTKRLGIAISDEEGRVAFPKTTFPNTPSVADEIISLLEKERITHVVLGEPNTVQGGKNPLQERISALQKKLEERGMKVSLEAEMWSSIEARRFQGKKESNDASAAAIILQRFLEKPKKQ